MGFPFSGKSTSKGTEPTSLSPPTPSTHSAGRLWLLPVGTANVFIWFHGNACLWVLLVPPEFGGDSGSLGESAGREAQIASFGAGGTGVRAVEILLISGAAIEPGRCCTRREPPEFNRLATLPAGNLTLNPIRERLPLPGTFADLVSSGN